MPVMQIEYEMSEQDFLDSQKLALKNLPNRTTKWIFRILPFWGLFMFLAVVWNLVRQGFTWDNGMIVPLTMGLLFLASPLLMNQTMRKTFRSNDIFRGQRSATVDDAGLTFTNPTSTIQVKWASVRNFVEDDTTFVLYQSGVIFYALPKRQLTPEQIAELRETFTRNIAAKGQAAVG